MGTRAVPRPTITDDPLWHRRGVAAYTGLNRTDPHATWSFQGFAFVGWSGEHKERALKGFIDAAPRGKFVIVDMDYGEGEWLRFGDPPSGYWSTKFIWTKLHNFGGTDGRAQSPIEASSQPA